MLRFVNLIDKASDVIGKAVSYLLLITVGACMIEITCRYMFNSPTVWSYEVEAFSCGILYMLIGSYVLLHRGHVGVDILYRKFNPKKQIFINIFVIFPLIAFTAAGLIYIGVGYFSTSFFMKETTYSSWSPYVWPIKMMIPVGGMLMMLQAFANLLRDIYTLGGVK